MRQKQLINGIIIILLLHIIGTSVVASPPEVKLPPAEIFVTMRATDGTNSWFDMMIFNIPPGYDIANGTYHGWCAQKSIAMTRGVNHSVRLFSSYDPNMPESYRSDNWSKINYVLNHKNQASRECIQEVIWYYISLEYYPSDPVAQALITETDQHGFDFTPANGQILAIIVEGVETIQRSFFEYTIPKSPVNPYIPGSGQTSDTPQGSIQNHAPTADATAGEPYTGFARGEITFDGSRSYDRDGIIISWKWDFGDGNSGSGEIVKHTYVHPGEYTVILTVKDEKGATDRYTTIARITEGNNPPSTPIISGPTSGHKDTLYEFTFVSTDPDDDSVRYIIDFGGDVIETVYFSSGIPITRNHMWSEPGRYIITVKAFDSKIESGTATIDILIDILFVQDFGYLIDEDSDGIYDSFYSNATGIKTKVEHLSNGNYLIDIDGEGMQYYEYNSATGSLNAYMRVPVIEYILVAVVLIGCLILLFVLERRRKRLRFEKR